MKKALKIIPHGVIIISGMLIVFFCIDRVNKPMGFMTNEFHKIITFALSLLSIGQSVFIISYQRKKERFEEAKRRKALMQRRAVQKPPVPQRGPRPQGR